MGKPVKIIVSTVIILIFLMVMAMAALTFLFDPNDYKSEISAMVKDKIGRDLVLEGDLKLSFFPWLGISTGKMILKNAQDFENEPFATLDEGVIQIKLLPLFTNKIETGGLVLKKLVLNLTRHKEGVNNWDDLTMRNQPDRTPSSLPDSNKPSENELLKTVAIGGITIENACLIWNDQQTGKHLEIKNINLKTDQFRVNEPVAVDVSFTALDSEANLAGSVKFTTALTVNEKLDHMILARSELDLIVEGSAVAKTLPAHLNAELAVDLSKQTVKISGFQLKSGDLKVTAEILGSGIKDHAYFDGPVSVEQFSPVNVMKVWGIEPPVMRDQTVLKQLAMRFDLEASEEVTSLKSVQVKLDDTRIQGLIAIKSGLQTEIAFHLEADALDADRYLPPITKQDKPISSPASALAVGASSIPIETLRRLNASGDFALQKLKISDLTLQDIHLKLDAKSARVSTQQSVNRFYQGSYSGNFSIDASHSEPALVLHETLNHVQMETLLKDYRGEAKISGIVSASAQLQGQSKGAKILNSSLNGQLNFHCTDGAIKGFNLQKMIDSGKALVKGSSVPVDPKNDQTLFSDMTGTASVKQGLIQNDDLVAKSSKFTVNGKGNANLNTEHLDYQLTARMIKTPATAAAPEIFHDTPVIVHIGGTFSKPTYQLDVASLLTEQNKAQIDKILDKNKDKMDKLMDKLNKKVGPGASDFFKRLF